jgi:RNase P/RNase MRP subunit p29
MHNLKSLDLIGKNILIENSSDISKKDLNGLVIFETKNIIVLKYKEKNIKIKKNEILKFKEI